MDSRDHAAAGAAPAALSQYPQGSLKRALPVHYQQQPHHNQLPHKRFKAQNAAQPARVSNGTGGPRTAGSNAYSMLGSFNVPASQSVPPRTNGAKQIVKARTKAQCQREKYSNAIGANKPLRQSAAAYVSPHGSGRASNGGPMPVSAQQAKAQQPQHARAETAATPVQQPARGPRDSDVSHLTALANAPAAEHAAHHEQSSHQGQQAAPGKLSTQATMVALGLDSPLGSTDLDMPAQADGADARHSPAQAPAGYHAEALAKGAPAQLGAAQLASQSPSLAPALDRAVTAAATPSPAANPGSAGDIVADAQHADWGVTWSQGDTDQPAAAVSLQTLGPAAIVGTEAQLQGSPGKGVIMAPYTGTLLPHKAPASPEAAASAEESAEPRRQAAQGVDNTSAVEDMAVDQDAIVLQGSLSEADLGELPADGTPGMADTAEHDSGSPDHLMQKVAGTAPAAVAAAGNTEGDADTQLPAAPPLPDRPAEQEQAWAEPPEEPQAAAATPAGADVSPAAADVPMPAQPDAARFQELHFRYTVAASPEDVATRDHILREYRKEFMREKKQGVRTSLLAVSLMQHIGDGIVPAVGVSVGQNLRVMTPWTSRTACSAPTRLGPALKQCAAFGQSGRQNARAAALRC